MARRYPFVDLVNGDRPCEAKIIFKRKVPIYTPESALQHSNHSRNQSEFSFIMDHFTQEKMT